MNYRMMEAPGAVAISVDAGKSSAVGLVADFTGERSCPPFTFDLNRDGTGEFVARVEHVTDGRDVRLVR